MSSSNLPPLTQCVLFALLSFVLASYVKARSVSIDAAIPLEHSSEKRFYIPVIISSDAIRSSLKESPSGASSAEIVKDNGLERKRTAAARLEYLDSLMPRSVVPKRKMFFQPLGYMSASARRLQVKNRPQTSQRDDSSSHGFRYG